MKFIHTADWHLGNYYSRFSEEENRHLQEARFTAVENLFCYAKENGISLVIAAGDQFDNGESRDPNGLLRLFSIVRNYPGIKVVMIAGNHDPYTNNCIYKSAGKSGYPENLIFINDKEIISFEESKIYASSLNEKFSSADPAEWIDAGQDESFKIAVAHGSLKIQGLYNPNDFPIGVDSAKAKNIDYLALGHWHSFYAHDENTFYPGVIEPLQFGDEGFALEVTLSGNNSPLVKKITGLNVFTWLVREINLDDGNLAKVFEELRKSSGKNIILSLKLTGYLSIENYKKTSEMLNAISFDFFKMFADNSTVIKPDEKSIMESLEEGLLKNVVHKLISIKEKEKDVSAIIKQEEAVEAADRALLMIHDYFNGNDE